MSVDPTRAYDYVPERIEALRSAQIPGQSLARVFYTSPEVHAADMDRIWRRHWLYAAHACELPDPGSWVTWQIGADTVLIVRGGDGVIRAFHNVCRHRGARLCATEAGQSRVLVCPYHAWTYDLDGRLRTQTLTEFGAASESLGLRHLGVKEVAELVFIALDSSPVDFSTGAADIAGRMRHQGLDNARLAHRIRYRVNANWKLIFENNRECYHCAGAHPEYVRGVYDVVRLSPDLLPEVERQEALADARFRAMGLDGATSSSAMTGGYWRCTRAPLMDGWHTQSLDGAPVAPLMGTMRQRNEWSRGTLRTTVFPNFWQHASDDHAVATRITPINATSCDVDVKWFVHANAVEGRDYDLERLLPFWQRTSEQDWALCAGQQVGVSSPGYVPGPYSRTREANVAHFTQWYLSSLAMPSPAKPATRLRSIGFRERPGA